MTQTSTEPVKDVAEFITRLKDLQLSDGQRRFFRGHSKHSYSLTPNVYRNEVLKDNESALYHDCLRLVPEAFTEDSNTIERLVRMQHEELPTRLLDVSESPLVALFFCVRYANDASKTTKEDGEKEDGEVIIFDWPENELYHSATLPEVCLAGVERQMSKGDWNDVFNLLRSALWFYIHTMFLEENRAELSAVLGGETLLDDAINKIQQAFYLKIGNSTLTQIISSGHGLFEFMQLAQKLLGGNNIKLIGKVESFIENVLNQTLDKYYFFLTGSNKFRSHSIGQHPLNNYDEFTRTLCSDLLYLPPLNNPRIKAQQGAFIVCSIVVHHEYEDDHGFAPRFNNIKIHRIRISHQHKAAILKELDNLGISEATMFPDLRTQIKSLEHRYKSKK